MGALVVGFGLGLVVAAQIGPISLLCIRSVLRGSLGVGIAIGAGAAVVDALYAAMGVLGAGEVLDRLPGLRLALGLVGAAVIASLGIRTIWSAFRVRMGGEAAEEVADVRRAFVTSLVATLSNPSTILSWAAIFAAASTARVTGDGTHVLLVGGVLLGTFTWFTVLSTAVNLARRRIGDRLLRWVDGVAGAGLLAFSGALGVRALRERA
jgi:putative LysE/RhtB family amino acid efflux pump